VCGALPGARLGREGIGLFQPEISRCGDAILCTWQGTIGHLRCNIILEIQPTWSRTTVFSTPWPCDAALHPHTTTPHLTTDGCPDCLPKFWLRGQAHPGCQESGHGRVVSPPRFPLGEMTFNGTGSYCGWRMDWWYQGGHRSWRMVRAYCTFFGQPKSPSPAIHCIYQRTQIMGGSATVRFVGELPTVATGRFRTDVGGDKCKGKETGWRRRGGDNHKGETVRGRRKGREERTVVYSKDDVVMNPPWSPPHSSRGTLWCGPNVLMHERPVFLVVNVVRYTEICCGLWLMPSIQPPEQQTHWPPATTSYCQWAFAKNRHQLHNQHADLGKWPSLHCNVCWPPHTVSTWACLQENNLHPSLCVNIHRRHHPPTWSAPRGCIRPWCTFHSRLLERGCEASAYKDANVYSVPSRHRWSLCELEWDGHTLLAWPCQSWSSQFRWLPPISGVCW